MAETKPKAKILFLDDDTFIVNVYSLKFTAENYEFHAATSVQEALTLLRNGFVPDIIICDLVMAQTSGFDFLQEIRTEHLAPDAYRIVLTNQSEELDKVQAEQLGANRYIVKVSMIPEEVVEIVDQVVAHRKIEKK